ATSAARQHAGPLRPDLSAAPSLPSRLRRLHHGQLPPAAAAAGIFNRHIQLHGGFAAVASGCRTGWAHTSTRLRRGHRRRLLRHSGSSRQKCVPRERRGVVWRRRDRHRRGDSGVHQPDARSHRSARNRHRLPDTVARAPSALSGDHDSGRRRPATAVGQSGREPRDFPRGTRNNGTPNTHAKGWVAMARYVWPEMSPWKRRPLTIPPDSWQAWTRLAAWELWMGVMLGAALIFGVGLIATAPQNVVT